MRNHGFVTTRQGFGISTVLAPLLLIATQPAMAGSAPLMEGMPGMDGHNHFELPFGHPCDQAEVDHVIRIAMGDMSFEPQSLRVTAGQTIRFVITNRSEVDHDFTIGEPTTQQAHHTEMLEAMESGSPAHGHDPNAVTVKAGEQRDLTWTFTAAGSLEYDCNVPGHFEAGMRGIIVVSKADAPLN
jgi:uncharacterized cupredoxin-like copper-binding protein